MKRKRLYLMRTAALLLFGMAFLCRCATMMTPTGGPKDSLPPVILAMTPGNYATNFTDKRITLTFDEYIQLKDQQKEFFTSPQMKKKPTLSIRGKSLVIQIKDTLLENTTYALNFGSAIADNNEGNLLNSMRYVFSTGDRIDSMVVSGYTADAYLADSVSKSFIWFFPADSVSLSPDYDSTVFNHKPAVIARAENNGIFIAQNLKPIPYRVYGVEDKNDNQIYDPGTDQIGFLEGTYNPAELPDFAVWYDSIRNYVSAEPQLYIRMFTDGTFRRQVLQQSSRPLQHQAMLYFGAPFPQIDSLLFDSIPSERIIIEPITHARDTLALWFDLPAEQLPDTIRGRITYLRHDSVNLLQPATENLKLSWRFTETKEQQKERERLEREREKALEAGEEWEEPQLPNPFAMKLTSAGDINPENPLTLDFDYPLTALDTAALLLTRQRGADVEQIPLEVRPDTFGLRRYLLRAAWELGSEYTLTIPEGAFTDIAGQRNDSLVTTYKILDPEKYALVKIQVGGSADSTDYVIQLLDGRGKLLQQRVSKGDGEVVFTYVPAGDIRLRVIEDRNGNGRWDTGNLIQRLQPERAEMYVDPNGADTFTTKVNWEFDISIDMSALFAPVTMESLTEMLDQRELRRLMKAEQDRASSGTGANSNRQAAPANRNSMFNRSGR